MRHIVLGRAFLKQHKICINKFSSVLDVSLKLFRLLDSQQVSLEDDEHVDRVTLLFGGYVVLVLSFGLVASADVLNWCEIVKNISGVPFLLPQQAIADVGVAKEMLFILYQHGLVSDRCWWGGNVCML